MEKKYKIISIITIVIIISLITWSIIIINNKNKEINNLQENLNSCEELLVKDAQELVSDSINLTKRQTFALDAQTAIEAANTYFMNETVKKEKGFPSNEGEKNCVDITTLINEGYFSINGKYDGKVVVEKYNNKYLFSVYLHNDKLMVNGKGIRNGENVQIKATNDDNTSDVVIYNESLFDRQCHASEKTMN